MGILNPVCTATDGIRVFALAYASSYSDVSSSYNILIKSNDYPHENVQDMTWSLVSAVPRDQYYYLSEDNINGRGYGCAVDNKGVFTALARISQQSKSAPRDAVVRGIQYTPGNAGAEGTWKNIDTSQPYVWLESTSAHLYNLMDPVTKQITLMHASVSTQGNDTGIMMASFNPATNTMEQNAVPWKLPYVTRSLTFGGNNALLALGQNLTSVWNLESFFVTKVLLTPGSVTMPNPPTLRHIVAYDLVDECLANYSDVNMWPLKDGAVLSCRSKAPGAVMTEVFTTDGANKVTQLTISGFAGLFDNVRTILLVQGSASPFLFMYNSSGIYGIALEVSTESKWASSSTRINIPDQYGLDIGGSSPSDGPSAGKPRPSNDISDKHESTSNGGMIGGVCAGIVVVAAVVVFLFMRKRRQQNKGAKSASKGLAGSEGSNTGLEGNNLLPLQPPIERAMKSDVTDSCGPHAVPPVPVHDPHGSQVVSPLDSDALGLPPAHPSSDPTIPVPLYWEPKPFIPPRPSNISSNSDNNNRTNNNNGDQSTNASTALPSTSTLSNVPRFWEPKPFIPPTRNNNNSNNDFNNSNNNIVNNHNSNSPLIPTVSALAQGPSTESLQSSEVYAERRNSPLHRAPAIPHHSRPNGL